MAIRNDCESENIMIRAGYDTTVHKLRNGGKTMDTIALILSIIGSLNWGLVGIFKFDLVAWLFGGQGSIFSRIVYTIVGLAGLWCISFLFRRNRIVDGE